MCHRLGTYACRRTGHVLSRSHFLQSAIPLLINALCCLSCLDDLTRQMLLLCVCMSIWEIQNQSSSCNAEILGSVCWLPCDLEVIVALGVSCPKGQSCCGWSLCSWQLRSCSLRTKLTWLARQMHVQAYKQHFSPSFWILQHITTLIWCSSVQP